jgi:hypothetical protein
MTDPEKESMSPSKREYQRLMAENLGGGELDKTRIIAYTNKAPTAPESHSNGKCSCGSAILHVKKTCFQVSKFSTVSPRARRVPLPKNQPGTFHRFSKQLATLGFVFYVLLMSGAGAHFGRPRDSE